MNELIFKLTVNEANNILTALQELPAKVANPITEKMREQAMKQLQENNTSTEQ